MTATGAFAALLLADGRLPAGGHTQSAGLEPALAAGLPVHDIPSYLAIRLATVARTDAATAVVTRQLLSQTISADTLQQAADAWAARNPSQHVRAASASLGRGLVRLVSRQWPGHPVVAALATAGRQLPRPVALGSLGWLLGVQPADLIRVACYDDVQSVTSAALKLEPLDPLQTVAWTLARADEIATIVRDLSEVTTPEEIPAGAAPALEGWVHAHVAGRGRRLFSA